jgi:hypothetical protein
LPSRTHAQPTRRRHAALIAVLVAAMTFAMLPASASPQDGSTDFQIVNGRPAPEGAYPWMAAFLFDGGQGCGASVIGDQWILTAAHCVLDERGQPSGPNSSFSFVVDTNDWTQPGQRLTTAQVIAHPNYDPITLANDVALIRTNELTGVTPVRLAGPGDEALQEPPASVRVIGYGALATGADGSEQLLEVDVDVVDTDPCNDALLSQGLDPVERALHVCAGNPTDDSDNPGRDSCQGDSGGPLFAVGEEPVQVGVVSRGGECGVIAPGVYMRVSGYRTWIEQNSGIDLDDPSAPSSDVPDQPIDDPGAGGEVPTGSDAAPLRIASGDGNDPVANAIDISRQIFTLPGEYGVLAASSRFPDALGGSALASYLGPLLYVDADGSLGQPTLIEFQRALDPGSTIFVLGGTAVISDDVVGQLQAAGFDVVRLGGDGRQETAKIVADAVIDVVNFGQGAPFDSVIISFEGDWPDAVTAGQISAFWGIPILLTPRDQLGGPAADYLVENQPSNVIVTGGTAVVSDAVIGEIEAITGPESTFRLGGETRLGTGAQITELNRFGLYPFFDEIFEIEGGEPFTDAEVVIAVNLRRPDAFAHVLAASTLAGTFGGVFAPLEGDDGSFVDQQVLDSICGLDARVIVIGGPDLVPDSSAAALAAATAGEGCTAG